MQIVDYRRILVLGNNGSGKSYLAKALGAATGLPLIHLDAHFWRPGWQMPTRAQWYEKMQEFTSGERWIIDGLCTHGDTMELRFQRADLVLFLEVNPLVCLSGVLRRNGTRRTDTATGHERDEKFDRAFWGFCRGILRFKSLRRPPIMALKKKYSYIPFVVVRGRRQMNALVASLKTEKER